MGWEQKSYMADYINKVLLKGRLGKAPELRFLPSGDPVANFSIATPDGQHVEWHPIAAYKELAERAKKEFDTGDMVYIEGKVKTRDYLSAEDRAAGRKPRKIREVIAEAVHLVEKSKKNSNALQDLQPNEGEELLEQPSEQAPNEIPSYL